MPWIAGLCSAKRRLLKSDSHGSSRLSHHSQILLPLDLYHLYDVGLRPNGRVRGVALYLSMTRLLMTDWRQSWITITFYLCYQRIH